MPRCRKCGELLREDERLLVLAAARTTDGGKEYEREKDLAVIHRCCDDGLSPMIEADAEAWRGNGRYACAHLRRKLQLGHWESRVSGEWVPCQGDHAIAECERVGPKKDAHRFVSDSPWPPRRRTS